MSFAQRSTWGVRGLFCASRARNAHFLSGTRRSVHIDLGHLSLFLCQTHAGLTDASHIVCLGHLSFCLSQVLGTVSRRV